MQYLLAFLVAMGILALLITIGNVLVLMTFARDSSLRNSTGLLIISLSLADFITGLIAVPCVITAMVPGLDVMTTGFGCNFSGVLVFSLFNCSLLNLSLISLQRFYLITKPHSRVFTEGRISVMILGIWMYSFGASCVPLYPRFNGFVVYPWSLSCILDLSASDGYLNKYYSAAYNTITYLICFVTLFLTQYRILRIVYSRTRTKETASSKTRQLSENRRHYATKMISCMILGFLVCTIPIMILLFMKVFENIPKKEFAAFAGFMTWFNSLLNPIIYWYFNHNYRHSFSLTVRTSTKIVKSHILEPMYRNAVSNIFPREQSSENGTQFQENFNRNPKLEQDKGDIKEEGRTVIKGLPPHDQNTCAMNSQQRCPMSATAKIIDNEVFMNSILSCPEGIQKTQ